MSLFRIDWHDIFPEDIIFDHELMLDFDRFHYVEEVDWAYLVHDIVVSQVSVVDFSAFPLHNISKVFRYIPHSLETHRTTVHQCLKLIEIDDVWIMTDYVFSSVHWLSVVDLNSNKVTRYLDENERKMICTRSKCHIDFRWCWVMFYVVGRKRTSTPTIMPIFVLTLNNVRREEQQQNKIESVD